MNAMLSRDLLYINAQDYDKLIERAAQIRKILNGLIRKLDCK